MGELNFEWFAELRGNDFACYLRMIKIPWFFVRFSPDFAQVIFNSRIELAVTNGYEEQCQCSAVTRSLIHGHAWIYYKLRTFRLTDVGISVTKSYHWTPCRFQCLDIPVLSWSICFSGALSGKSISFCFQLFLGTFNCLL